MSIVALALNLILAALLVGALLMGWRLNQRLKGLRASHADFTRAVADLDAAAMRAAQALAALRNATDEAQSALDSRLEAAGRITAELDEALEAQAELARRRAAAPATSERLTADRLTADRGWSEERRERPAFSRAEPASTPRSRARVDDDLFEPESGPGRLRAINGGRP